MKPSATFTAIVAEGGLLPADFLAELLSPKTAIEGLEPESYNLAEGERVSEQVNRSWNRLKGRWVDFQKAIAGKGPGESTTTETRDRWLHPIFQELGFGQRLSLASPIEVDGRAYAVSHGWRHVPIHLVGSHVDIDHRTPGATGAAKASPHSLVQQVLNASDDHLWGIVSNGLVFRLLRRRPLRPKISSSHNTASLSAGQKKPVSRFPTRTLRPGASKDSSPKSRSVTRVSTPYPCRSSATLLACSLRPQTKNVLTF